MLAVGLSMLMQVLTCATSRKLRLEHLARYCEKLSVCHRSGLRSEPCVSSSLRLPVLNHLLPKAAHNLLGKIKMAHPKEFWFSEFDGFFFQSFLQGNALNSFPAIPGTETKPSCPPECPNRNQKWEGSKKEQAVGLLSRGCVY